MNALTSDCRTCHLMDEHHAPCSTPLGATVCPVRVAERLAYIEAANRELARQFATTSRHVMSFDTIEEYNEVMYEQHLEAGTLGVEYDRTCYDEFIGSPCATCEEGGRWMFGMSPCGVCSIGDDRLSDAEIAAIMEVEALAEDIEREAYKINERRPAALSGCRDAGRKSFAIQCRTCRAAYRCPVAKTKNA